MGLETYANACDGINVSHGKARAALITLMAQLLLEGTICLVLKVPKQAGVP